MQIIKKKCEIVCHYKLDCGVIKYEIKCLIFPCRDDDK